MYLSSAPSTSRCCIDSPLTELDGSENTSDHEADTGESKGKVEWLPSWLVPKCLVVDVSVISSNRCKDVHSDDEDNPHCTEQGETGHLDGDTSQKDISTSLSLADVG